MAALRSMIEDGLPRALVPDPRPCARNPAASRGNGRIVLLLGALLGGPLAQAAPTHIHASLLAEGPPAPARA
jgi:hypothetical protein